MPKTHSPWKQLRASVQDSINNLTIGNSNQTIASRSTTTATLASLDIVNWTRLFLKVHWNQLILIESFRINFTKSTKEKNCCAGLVFKYWAIIWNPRNLLAGVDTGRWSPTKVYRGNWKVRLILKPEFRKKSVTNQRQSNWSYAASASRNNKRRRFLCDTHFYGKGNNWIGKSNRIYFTSIGFILFVKNPRVLS